MRFMEAISSVRKVARSLRLIVDGEEGSWSEKLNHLLAMRRS
jgi:hypothetical protein